MMRKTLFWIGAVLCGIGAAVIATSAVLNYFGVGTSYNFGNPEKFEFVLVPIWQIGLAVAAIGGAFLLVQRRVKSNG
jgi:hypothetical protein